MGSGGEGVVSRQPELGAELEVPERVIFATRRVVTNH